MSETAASEPTGAVTGGVKLLLRLEGLTLGAAMVVLYATWGGPWWIFAILFLAPDLSFLAYLASPRAGAVAYNALHATVGPLLLALAGIVLPWPMAQPLALIWLAHIGFDRALGYGLKYAGGFGFTHMGRIGKP